MQSDFFCDFSLGLLCFCLDVRFTLSVVCAVWLCNYLSLRKLHVPVLLVMCYRWRIGARHVLWPGSYIVILVIWHAWHVSCSTAHIATAHLTDFINQVNVIWRCCAILWVYWCCAICCSYTTSRSSEVSDAVYTTYYVLVVPLRSPKRELCISTRPSILIFV